MPIPATALQLQDFFGTGVIQTAESVSPIVFYKTIQKAYRFFVYFIPDILPGIDKTLLYNRIGYPPILRSWHVQSIDLQNYKFDKDVQHYGPIPRAMPRLDFDGFEIKIDFEEDDKGTIAYFINWLQRSIIDEKGLYTPPDICKIPVIFVLTENDIGLPIGLYSLHDLFYMSSDGPNAGYDKNESVKYNIVFNADRINSFQPQAWAIAKLNGVANRLI